MPTPQFVYIMTNRPRGAFYVGRTVDLIRRVWEHRNKLIRGHTFRYNLVCLAWWELHPSTESAWMRERRIKRWRREWKINLVEQMNPGWKDLWFEIGGEVQNPPAPHE